MKINPKVFWILVICWSIFIGYYSLVPEEQVPGSETVGTNLLHLPSYFVLSLFYFHALGKDSKKSYYYCVAFAFAYGILLEILQSFTGYRQFSFLDVCVNLTGAVLAPLAVKGIDHGIKKLA